jgi:hypothetical protein
MARFLYLSPRGSKRQTRYAVAAIAGGLACYGLAVWLSVGTDDATGWQAAWSRVGHDALLLLTGLLVGAGGFVFAVMKARRARLVDETGVLLLSLTHNIKTLAKTLAAMSWSVVEPMQSSERMDNLKGADVAVLLYSEEGTALLVMASVRSLEQLASSADNVTSPEDDARLAAVVEQATSNVGAIADVAAELHQRALELLDYAPVDGDKLLAATGNLRAACDSYRFEAHVDPGGPASQARQAVGLFTGLIGYLGETIAAAQKAEAATAEVLAGSPRGRAVLDPYLEELAEDAADREFAVDLAQQMTKVQGNLDSMNELMTQLQADIEALRSH